MRSKTIKARDEPVDAALGYAQAALNALDNAQRILPAKERHLHTLIRRAIKATTDVVRTD